MSKTLIPVVIAAGFVYLVATLALVYGVTHRGDEFHPLDYGSPQRVLNPIVRPGDKLIVETDEKCNVSGEPVAVSGGAYIRNIDTNDLIARPGTRLDSYVRVPGCPSLHFENELPPLPPGRYRIEGVDIATRGAKEQREAWNTEIFCATDANGEGC